MDQQQQQTIYKHFATSNMLKLETTQPIFKYSIQIPPTSQEQIQGFSNEELKKEISRSLRLSHDIDTSQLISRSQSQFSLYTNKQIDVNSSLNSGDYWQLHITENHIEINITVENQILTETQERIEVLKSIIDNAFSKLDYLSYGNGLYNPIDPPNAALSSDRSVSYQTFTWKGVSPKVVQFRGKFYVQVETTPVRMLRMNVFEVIKKLKERQFTEGEIEQFLVGKTVKTSYFGGETLFYEIMGVDFSLTPSTAFQSNRQEVSCEEEVRAKYRINLRDKIQPILKVLPKQINNEQNDNTHNNNSKAAPYFEYMISSLCSLFDQIGQKYVLEDQLLGLEWCSDSLELFDSLSRVSHFLQNNAEVEEILNKWHLRVSKDYEQVGFQYLRISPILLKNLTSNQNEMKSVSDLTCKRLCSEFDGYYDQVFCGNESFTKFSVVDSWIVCVHKENQLLAEEMAGIISQFKIFYNYHLSEPKFVVVDSTDRETWEKEFEEAITKYSPQFALIFVKKELETLWFNKLCNLIFTVQKSIPCQIIKVTDLASDIPNNNSYYGEAQQQQQQQKSYLTKRTMSCRILAQMTAKLGESPWLVKDLPFNSVPATMMGFNVSRNAFSKKIVITGACSVNKQYSKYQSDFRVIDKFKRKDKDSNSSTTMESEREFEEKTESELSNEICMMMKEMTNGFLNSFQSLHKTTPTWIIIIREGIMSKNCQHEKDAVLSLLSSKKQQNPESKGFNLIFATSQLSTELRTYQFTGSSSENANSTNVYSLGTGGVIDESLDKTSFYIYTMKLIKNCPFAMKYQVLHADKQINIYPIQLLSDLQELLYNTYLLNYTFNTKTASPACLQNARKYGEFLQLFLTPPKSNSLTIDLGNLKAMSSSYKLFYI